MKHRVLQGIDRLEAMDEVLRGQRLGVVASGGSINRQLRHTVDVLRERYEVTALYNTVMGIRGEYRYGEDIPSYVDGPSGMTVTSIFNRETLAPTEEMLSGIDVLVFDIREAGVRFFEYLHCCAAILKACARYEKPVVVLDRATPLGGETVEGTVCPPGMHTIVGDYQLPTRTALTMGEFACYVNGEYGIGCDLTVIGMEGWTRGLYHDDTDLPWLLPSPSLPHVTANLLYAGLCVLEGIGNLSEGRGTSKPFELVGAPWVDGIALAKAMEALGLPEVSFAPVYFKPTASKFAGEVCQGVQLIVFDKRGYQSFRTALVLVDTLREMYPGKLQFTDNSVGHDVLRQPSEPVFDRYIDQLLATADYAQGRQNGPALEACYAPAREAYRRRKAAYHLYA